MTKAILACKHIKKFSNQQRSAFLAFFYAKHPWLPENFFVRNGPGDTGNGYRQKKKINDLGV